MVPFGDQTSSAGRGGAAATNRILHGRGVEVEMTADHGISRSFYLRDPDGNRLEFYTQVMSHAAAKQYLRDASTAADALQPLDLEALAS